MFFGQVYIVHVLLLEVLIIDFMVNFPLQYIALTPPTTRMCMSFNFAV